MAGNRRKSGWKRSAVKWGLFVLLFVFLVLLSLYLPPNDPPQHKLDCMNRLRQIGFTLSESADKGVDIYSEPGARFLLQIAPEIEEERLSIFICPEHGRFEDLQWPDARARLAQMFREDWRTAPCSYRGPDKWLLELLRTVRDPENRRIIACDLNGPNGDEPHHESGVAVLYEGRYVGFLWWGEIEGSNGGPVPVGPNSPDPRFRHLVP